MIVKPDQLQAGDRFRKDGHMHEVVSVKPSRFGIYHVTVRRLTAMELTFDYDADVEIVRPT